MKNPNKAYVYCPLCGHKLVPSKGTSPLICSECNFHLYNNPKPCNGIIIENRSGEILLVKRKFPPKKNYWDLPGGFIDANESLEESVRREAKEELDIDLVVEEIIGIYHDYYVYQNIKYPTLGIVVTAKALKEIEKASDDISQFKFFPKKEVLGQKLAFESLRRSLEDYLRDKI